MADHDISKFRPERELLTVGLVCHRPEVTSRARDWFLVIRRLLGNRLLFPFFIQLHGNILLLRFFSWGESLTKLYEGVVSMRTFVA